MKKIEMVDLKSQYQKIKTEVDAAMQSVMDSGAFVKGQLVKDFEENLANYLGVKHVIACANGTDALQIALMALDLKPGDEVITTDFTFVATAEVIALLQLTPILVDADPFTFNIDVDALKKAITPKTKAIIPVHLFGQCADMEAILEIAKTNNIAVIEDTAQATGASYTFSNGDVKKAGCMGEIGTTSFFPTKNLACYGDGGALFTNNDELAKKIKIIANHGMEVRYYHSMIGVNSRLDTLQAAVLNVKLPYLDQYNESRQKAAAAYDSAFKNAKRLQIPARNESSTHIFHQYTLVLNALDRDALRKHLDSKGIPSMIYYPVPLHKQEAYKSDRYSDLDFPISSHLSQNVLSLPMHTELDEEQIKYITDSVLEFIK